jgi:hypothetical protein
MVIMDVRRLMVFAAAGIMVALLCLASPAAGQANGNWVLPRTEFGHPDLQGNWSNATVTPVERPEGQGPILSSAEVARLEGREEERLENRLQPIDPERPPPAVTGSTGGYDGFYFDRGDEVAVVHGEPRSSLITHPADGRIPPLSAEGQRRREETQALRGRYGEWDHPELRPLGERCIMSFGSSAGPPMRPNYNYNNNYTIVQTADHVVILAEMVHDVRIIELGDGPRLPEEVQLWMGDSRGHWEGNTLVVETTNNHPRQSYTQGSRKYKVVERFTRVDENTLLYEFTVDDPTTYSQPWGGQIPMNRFDDMLYEYACHEGNYALEGIMRGGRFEASQENNSQR